MKIVCERCGEEFDSSRKKRFCSRRCQRAALRNNDINIMRRGNTHTTEEAIEKRVEEKFENYRFSKCYGENNNIIEMVCKTCGSVVVTTKDSIKPSRTRTPICKTCTDLTKKELRAEEAKLKHEVESFNKPVKKIKQIGFFVCEECGEAFIPKHSNSVYCSKQCSQRKMNRLHKDKRIKKISDRIVDRNIGLKRLAVRDNDTCYLCGLKVDWSDIEKINGAYIAGNYYPSKDHVIPISKGGTESWENVRLAHRVCNFKKSDKLMEAI